MILEIGFATQHALIVTADCVQSACPDITFVRNSALQKTDDRRLRLFAAIFDGADKSRHVREVGALGEKPRYFDIRIDAVLEFAIEL